MKNPFAKTDQTGIIVGAGLAVVTAGALAYLYLTENGRGVRRSIKGRLKNEAKDLVATAISNKTGIRKKTVKKATDHLAN